jgi:hypothetical protein
MEPRKRPVSPEKDPSSGTAPSAKRRYEPPRLVEYGSVGKLTQSGGVTTKDSGNMKRVCL